MKKVYIIAISLLSINLCTAQTSFNAAGGNINNESVSISYSIGQIFNETSSLNEGVQLPYNIFEIVGIDDIENIFLNILAYPNPTSDYLELKISMSDFDYSNVLYQITDINGRMVKTEKITDFQTLISMENLPQGIYILEVKTSKNKSKTFKIVKN